jgi:hypothetical protein
MNNMIDRPKEEILNQEISSPPQICRPAGLRWHLQRLAGALKLAQSNRQQLKSLFSAETKFVPVYNPTFQCELAFSFWGFVKSNEARAKLLDFLHWLLQPRLYMFATTKEGNHVEGVIIIALQKLQVQGNVFELWLEYFFDTLQMSAVTLVFTEYLGEQMLTSMDRIHHSQKLRSNLFVDCNKDFRLLYENLLKTRAE